MLTFLVGLVLRVVFFGVVLTFASKRSPNVRVEPRSALPVVALTFALLNTFLYWVLAGIMNVATLWMLSFLVPFAVNTLLLWLTDRLLGVLTIEGTKPLLFTAVLLTIAQLVVRVLLAVLI